MAKGADQDSVKQDFLRRLLRGEDIDQAAAKAGINCQETIDLYLDEVRQQHSDKTRDRLHIEALQIAISTLKDLAQHGAEDDKVKCEAAKALLKFSSDNLRNKTAEKLPAAPATPFKLNLFDFGTPE